MTIDIVIPTVDNPQLLDRALCSIENHCSLNLITIYVINDNSCYPTDLYQQIINKHNKLNIQYQKLTKNIGPGPARNIGIKAGHGDWICFLDCDDLYVDDVTLYCDNDYDFILTDVNVHHNLFPSYAFSSEGTCGPIHGIGVKRSFIEKYNLYFPEIKYGQEDTIFKTLLLALSDNFKEYSDKSYYQHLARPDSNFLHRKPIKLYLNDVKFWHYNGIATWISHLNQQIEKLKINNSILNGKQWNYILINTALNLMENDLNHYKELPQDVFLVFAYLYKKWINIKSIQVDVSQLSSHKILILTFIEKFWILKEDILIFNPYDNRIQYLDFFMEYEKFFPDFIKNYYAITINCYYDVPNLINILSSFYYTESFELTKKD